MKPKQPVEPRICLFCEKEFQPKKGNQRCCGIKCRARLQHNPKIENSYKILNAIEVGDEDHQGLWAFTAMIHGYAVKGFSFNQRTGFIRWPPNFLSFGPYWKRPDHGFNIPSSVLQKLIQKWIDQHDSELQHKRVEEQERLKAEQEAYKAKLAQVVPGERCSICNGKCYRKLFSPWKGNPCWVVRCIDYGHLVRDLTEQETQEAEHEIRAGSS